MGVGLYPAMNRRTRWFTLTRSRLFLLSLGTKVRKNIHIAKGNVKFLTLILKFSGLFALFSNIIITFA